MLRSGPIGAFFDFKKEIIVARPITCKVCIDKDRRAAFRKKKISLKFFLKDAKIS